MSPARRFLAELARHTADPPGFTRPSYGKAEQIAHDLARGEAEKLGLEVTTDPAGNLYMTLPGRDRNLPAVFIGSHLDSVSHGGNFDGAAGIAAGLGIVDRIRTTDHLPPRDITVVAIRAEESVWFPMSYIGSKAIFGRLGRDDLTKLRRSDTGQSLANHMREAGFDPDLVADGMGARSPAEIAAFFEVHIEQGPVLESEQITLGLVTGIRGSFRYRQARCLGAYGHSGGTPRTHRLDAVFATAELIQSIEARWRHFEEVGEDLVVTFGILQTNPEQHAFSKVPGETSFCVDARSLSQDTLDAFEAELKALCDGIGKKRSVTFDLGQRTASDPNALDAVLRDGLHDLARASGIPCRLMASGGGHDASVFAGNGVPSALIFVRNQNGSHNPDEHMHLEDLDQAITLLAEFLRKY